MTNNQKATIHIQTARQWCKYVCSLLAGLDAPQEAQIAFLGTLDACDRAIQALPVGVEEEASVRV